MAQWRSLLRDATNSQIPFNFQRRCFCAPKRSQRPVRQADYRAGTGKNTSASHAHAARNHQLLVRAKVVKLFEQTPADDVRLIFIKEEVFGIPDGRPIIGPEHPVMVEMFAQPIVGTQC